MKDAMDLVMEDLNKAEARCINLTARVKELEEFVQLVEVACQCAKKGMCMSNVCILQEHAKKLQEDV